MKDEYLLLWARFILEIQKSMDQEELKRLLKEASLRSFHKAPRENASAIDTAGLLPPSYLCRTSCAFT